MLSKLLLIALALLMAACGRVEFQTDAEYSYLSVQMTAQESTDLIEGLLTGGASPVMAEADAELGEGEIVVSGIVNTREGDQHPGSLSLRLWADNGRLQVAVSQFSFAGFTAEQSAIDAINRDIAAGLSAWADRPDNNSDFSELTVSTSGIRFTIRTPR